jgi:hypothetical protein
MELNMKLNQKHFMIRTDPTNPLQVLKYLGQFIDKWDYGIDLGNKSIIHYNNTLKMNGLIFHKDVKPKDRNRYKLKSDQIYEHIEGNRTYYFTSDPFSRYRLCVPDIDNKTDNKDSITPFLNLFTSHFPDIYYDRGSSGKSLHPYIKLDMLPLYDYYIFDSEDYRSYPKYANEVFNKAGYILKLFGHHIIAPEHTFIDDQTDNHVPVYDVEIDAIKGSYPDYDFFVNNKTGKFVIKKVINHGVLVKLPRLSTKDDCMRFYSSRVYSILDFLSFVVYIGSSLVLSSCLNEEEQSRVEDILSELEPVLMAHSVFPSPKGKDSVSQKFSCKREHGPNNSNYCLAKTHLQAKNKDFDNTREYNSDANKRRIATAIPQ